MTVTHCASRLLSSRASVCSVFWSHTGPCPHHSFKSESRIAVAMDMLSHGSGLFPHMVVKTFFCYAMRLLEGVCSAGGHCWHPAGGADQCFE